MSLIVGVKFKNSAKVYYFSPEGIEFAENDGVIVETPSTRLDSRISAQIAEITEKMITGTENELEQK